MLSEYLSMWKPKPKQRATPMMMLLRPMRMCLLIRESVPFLYQIESSIQEIIYRALQHLTLSPVHPITELVCFQHGICVANSLVYIGYRDVLCDDYAHVRMIELLTRFALELLL